MARAIKNATNVHWQIAAKVTLLNKVYFSRSLWNLAKQGIGQKHFQEHEPERHI